MTMRIGKTNDILAPVPWEHASWHPPAVPAGGRALLRLATGSGYEYHAAVGSTATAGGQGLGHWHGAKQAGKHPRFHHAGGELWHGYP